MIFLFLATFPEWLCTHETNQNSEITITKYEQWVYTEQDKIQSLCVYSWCCFITCLPVMANSGCTSKKDIERKRECHDEDNITVTKL